MEALEALRLLSGTTQSLPAFPVELDFIPGEPQSPGHALAPIGSEAWDAVLHHARVEDFLPTLTRDLDLPTTTEVDRSAVESGLEQLNRYLSRAWYRAGIAPQVHDDCSQAVYLTLLQNLGRDRFDGMLSDIGSYGIRDVLSRETAEGPDFFRAIDTVKKRAQREKTFQPLENLDIVSGGNDHEPANLWRDTLQEAIDHSLTAREAALVQQTLLGKSPSEIAEEWGIAPKTVSNEKTRAIQKLREALVNELLD